jgi:hypothetical protein
MIKVDINKAKEIVHTKRRYVRANLLKQLDIEATVPLLAKQAEVQRQVIRDKFAAIQTEIDNAETSDQLKGIITKL